MATRASLPQAAYARVCVELRVHWCYTLIQMHEHVSCVGQLVKLILSTSVVLSQNHGQWAKCNSRSRDFTGCLATCGMKQLSVYSK